MKEGNKTLSQIINAGDTIVTWQGKPFTVKSGEIIHDDLYNCDCVLVTDADGIEWMLDIARIKSVTPRTVQA